MGLERVLGAATWIAANIEAPGVIRQVSSFRRIVLGELDGRDTRACSARSPRCTAWASPSRRRTSARCCGPSSSLSRGSAAVGTVTRMPVGDFRAVPETRAMLSR